MADQAELSALRERVGRTEVQINYQHERLQEHTQRMESISSRLNSIEDRLGDIERLLRTINRVMRWGLMSLGTMVLEAMTGTLKTVVRMASVLGSGS